MFKASVQFDVEMCSARPIYPEMLESVIYLFVCLFSQKKARIRRQRTASVTATSELEGPVSWVETTSWFITSSILFERDNEQMFNASVQFDVEMCSARPIYPKMLELYFKRVIHRIINFISLYVFFFSEKSTDPTTKNGYWYRDIRAGRSGELSETSAWFSVKLLKKVRF